MIKKVALILFALLTIPLVIITNLGNVWGWVIILVALMLFYSSVTDISSYEVSLIVMNISVVVLIVLNVLFLIINPEFIMDVEFGENLIAGAIGAITFYIIIYITKKKGMGEGDLFIITIIGLTLGIYKLILAFYVMVIVGSIFGVFMGIKNKKIKGLKMPFVPFMYLGFVVSAVWGEFIINAYLSAFWIL